MDDLLTKLSWTVFVKWSKNNVLILIIITYT